MTGVCDRAPLRELYFKGRVFCLVLDEEVRETGIRQTMNSCWPEVEGPCGKDLKAANMTT